MASKKLTKHDIQERSQKLHKVQEYHREVSYIKNPKMPCPGCAGKGTVAGGSLGDICLDCMGERVFDMPGTEALEQPDFAKLRAGITSYGDALDAGGVLPPASSVPTLEELEDLRVKIDNQAKQLYGAAEVAKQLNAGIDD